MFLLVVFLLKTISFQKQFSVGKQYVLLGLKHEELSLKWKLRDKIQESELRYELDLMLFALVAKKKKKKKNSKTVLCD
jgi:hypothetical protein